MAGIWALGSPSAQAQEPTLPVIAGEVRIGNELADSGTVVLHRVSVFFSGEVDSVSVDPQGGFEFVVPEPFDPLGDDVYFASTRYQGVLYFGGPVSEAADTVGTYLIRAYPTVPAGPSTELHIAVRNMFVEKAPSSPGWWVTDLFEIHNDTETTVVASEMGATWSHSLPPGAVDFQVGESDLAPEAASFSGGAVHVSAPVPPGERVYLFRYNVPAEAFSLPLADGTESMELLFREPAGDLAVSGLAAVGPIDMEGATFRRFAGRDLAATVVTVEPGRPVSPTASIPLVAAFLALALTLAGSVLALRGSLPSSRRARARRSRLMLKVARLDEKWSNGELEPGDYQHRRNQLLTELE